MDFADLPNLMRDNENDSDLSLVTDDQFSIRSGYREGLVLHFTTGHFLILSKPIY